jgi:hypothetical protein
LKPELSGNILSGDILTLSKYFNGNLSLI